MLKGKQTNRSECVCVCVWEACNRFPTVEMFHCDDNARNLWKNHQTPASDAWHTVYDPFGNVYYAACDRAHGKWLQAAAMPGESGKRSQAKQLAWLEGGHAVTRKHVLKMHKAPGISRVFETHRLSLHKGTERRRGGASPPRCTPAGPLRMHKKTPSTYVWCRTCLKWL